MARSLQPELAIFDLGNVVFRVDWQPMFDSWSNTSGVAALDLKKRFQFDESFAEFERGEISGSIFHKRLCKTLGVQLSYERFVAGWNAIYQEPISEVEFALSNLRGKLQVVAFTNTNKVHSMVWPERYRKVLTNFEHIFASSDMGLRKPEAEGFKQILDTCGVKAERSFFFDDLQLNIDAASRLGLNAILVDSPKVVSSELIRLGLLSQPVDND